MGWAAHLIEKLQRGETVQARPRGGSMAGKTPGAKATGHQETPRKRGFRQYVRSRPGGMLARAGILGKVTQIGD